MVFSMRLKSNPDQRAALEAAIAAGKKVSVLPIKASTINLTSTSTESTPLARLFDEFNFARHAGLAEDEVAVNAMLSGLGAKVFKAAIDNPMLLKLDYCFKVEGLGPVFDGKVRVDWDRAYTDVYTHFSGGGFWFKADIQAEVERLRQQGAVSVEINGGTAKDEDYVRSIAERMVARLFVPDLSSTPTAGNGGNGGWSFTSYQLKITDRRELKTEEYRMVRRELVEREFCLPMVLSEIRAHRDQLIRSAD
jgi:hypothetical protein